MKKLDSHRAKGPAFPWTPMAALFLLAACGEEASGPAPAPDEAGYLAVKAAYESALASDTSRPAPFLHADSLCAAFLAANPTGPRSDDALFFRGHMRYELGRFEESKAHLRQLLAGFPGSSRRDDGEFYLARGLYGQDSLVPAQALFSAFEGKHPASVHNGAAAFYAGMTHYRQGNPAAAQPFYQKVLDTYASSAKHDDARYYLGRCQYDQARHAEALAIFQPLSTASPAGPYADNAAYYVGAIGYATKDYPGCIAAMRDLLARFPASVLQDNAHYYIGKSLYRQRKPAEAEPELLLAAGTAPPGNVADYALYYLVRIKVDAKDCAGAAAPLGRLRAEFPGKPPLAWSESYAAAKGCAIP